MKKVLSGMLVSLLAVLMLAGCGGSAPAGMDTNRLETEARALVDVVNAREYRQLTQLFTAEKITAEAWAESLDPYLDEFGDFKAYKGTSFSTGEEAIEDAEGNAATRQLAYVLLTAEYTETTVVWRVVFSPEYEIIGLWF